MPVMGLKAYRSNTGAKAFHAVEDGLVHISISATDRYPTWDEVASVRDYLAPEMRMVMHLPPTSEYVNVHATTFHLWQVVVL